MSAETCPESVSRGGDWDTRRQPCGKPVKRNGKCGIHARSDEQAAARRERWAVEERARGELWKLADALTIAYGQPFFSNGTQITLSRPAAEALLAERAS